MKQITETGVRGFLKWFKAVQPGIYQKIAPALPKIAPAAFSDYHAGGWRTAGLSRDDAVKKLRGVYKGNFTNRMGMEGLASYDVGYSSYSAYTGSPTSGYVSAYTGANTGSMPPTTVDTSDAANGGISDTSTTSGIASLINSVSSGLIGVTAAASQAGLINTQLSRAQAGLTPLNMELPEGVPMVAATTTTASSTEMLIFLALGAGALLLLMRK
jgi:hypothetical protein